MSATRVTQLGFTTGNRSRAMLIIVSIATFSLTTGCYSARRANSPTNTFASSNFALPHSTVDRSRSNVQPVSYVETGLWNDESSEEPVAPEIGPNQQAVANQATITPSNLQVDLQAAEDIAMSNHPAIAKIQAKIESLRGAWVQAGLRNNPVFGYQGGEIGNNGSGGQNGVYFGGTIQRGGKRNNAQQVIANDINVARTQLHVEQRRIRNTVRLEFVKTLVAQRRLKLSKELEEIAGKTKVGVKKLFEAEEVSKVDLIRAELAFNKTEILSTTAQTNFEASRLRLATVLMVGENQTLTVQGDLEDEPEDYFDQMDWESVVATAIAANPQLAAATAALSRANAKLCLERSKAVQDLQTQFSVAYDDDTNYTIGGIQVGMPIPVFDRNQGAIHQAINEITMSDHEISRTQLALKRRLAELLGQYRTAKQRSSQLAETIIPASEETYQLISRGYTAGESDFTTLAAAQQALVEARLLQLDSIESLWVAFYAIDGLVVE